MPDRLYWIGLRIGDDDSGRKTRAKIKTIVEKVAANTGPCWSEMESFMLLRSAYPLGTISGRIESVINPSNDLVVIGVVDQSNIRVMGPVTDPSVFELIRLARRKGQGDTPGKMGMKPGASTSD